VESKTLNATLPSHTRYVGAKTGSTDPARSADGQARGLRRPSAGSAENFKLLFSFADKIGAAVGRLTRRRRCRICAQ